MIEALAVSGGSIEEEIVHAGQHFARLSESAQGLYKLEERADLVRWAGSDEKAAEHLAIVQGVLAKAAPDFVATLRASGALHRARVVAYLAEIGRVSGVRGAVQSGRT